jgi:hypothetical protein
MIEDLIDTLTACLPFLARWKRGHPRPAGNGSWQILAQMQQIVLVNSKIVLVNEQHLQILLHLLRFRAILIRSVTRDRLASGQNIGVRVTQV